ncbi:MAG TPA: hypothetical protein H9698_00280 [Candidatus Ruthenibacterium merdavium]|uniref:Uncharacterized protein n=1 Tax=Candidatus Ruthenibacterium merdavium TaxID=2838752 RepID=A0A9D2Q2M5_9FIRM|nr:hypothetical protein [Candidatus Ruthenibacterium merdavium]
MSQQEENGGCSKDVNGCMVLEKQKEEKSLGTTILHTLFVSALTAVLPFFVIVFFDLYNKSNLANYKVFDVQLSYSFNTILSKYLISGILFLGLIICGVWVCQVGGEYHLWWKQKSDLKKRMQTIKKCEGRNSLNKVRKKVCENERKKLYEEKKLKAEKWLSKVFAFIFLFPIAFAAYICSMAGLDFSEYGINDLQIFGYVMMWLVFSLLFLAFFLWLMDDKKQKKYVLLWLLSLSFLLIVFSFSLKIDWKVFFTWETLWMFFAVIVLGGIFLGPLSFFYKLEKDIWEKIEGKVAQWLKRDEVELKIVRFLSTVAFCTFGMLMFVLLVSQGVHEKGVYSVVYQSQESDGIIGISVYEDDTRMIVIPAREVQKGDSVSYEVIEEYGKDEKGQSISIYSHRYMDKTGLFIKRVPNHQIDWKNRLNKQ